MPGDLRMLELNSRRFVVGRIMLRSCEDPVVLLFDFSKNAHFRGCVTYNYNNQSLCFRFRRRLLPDFDPENFLSSPAGRRLWHVAEDTAEFFGCVSAPRSVTDLAKARLFAKNLDDEMDRYERSLSDKEPRT